MPQTKHADAFCRAAVGFIEVLKREVLEGHIQPALFGPKYLNKIRGILLDRGVFKTCA